MNRSATATNHRASRNLAGNLRANFGPKHHFGSFTGFAQARSTAARRARPEQNHGRGLIFEQQSKQICFNTRMMLTRLIRYLVTSTVLLTMAVAGLPVFVCVSDAHGAMIEFGGPHHDKREATATHHTLFDHVEDSAHSDPCVDFRLERGTIAQDSRGKQEASSFDGSDSASTPHVTSARASLRASAPARVVFRAAEPSLHPTLRERRTIVLLI